MGRKSTIAADPAIREAVDKAIARGCTIDAIKDMLDAMGAEISRSAIGRHSQKYAAIAERQRDIRAAAEAFAGEFGSVDDQQSRLMIQLITTALTEKIIDLPGETSAFDMKLLTGAVKDAVGAAKIDDDRRRALRKQAFEEAATVAADAVKKTGASAETINRVRAEIMGIEL